MNGKKVLVTGGLGNLGSWISKHLVKEGYEVFILSRKAEKTIPNIEYKIIEADVTKINELEENLNFDIDYCIHAASYNEFFLQDYPKKALDINSFGTRNLLEILSRKNIKNFIYLSTFHVYGANSGIITEQSVLDPKNDYASTHLFAEYYVKQFGFTHNLKYTILRLTNSFGEPTFVDSNKWYLVLNDLVKSAFESNEIIIKSNGKAKRDFIYMGDVSVIVDKLLQLKATNEIFNLSSNKSYEIITLANIVKNVFQKRYNKDIKISINENDTAVYDLLVVKNDKLKSTIDFDITDNLEEEVENIFKLLEKNHE
jgi:UDP-glucose 4-epimerase